MTGGGLLPLIVRRLVGSLPVLVVVSLAVYMLVQLVPGDPAVTLAGGLSATPESIARIRAELHLNDPFLVQYGRWVGHAVRFDLGNSLVSGRSVAADIGTRLPVTLGLVVASAFFALVIGVPLGIVSGVWPGSVADSVSRGVASLGLAIPGFWLAVVLVSFFAVDWGLLPSSGYVAITNSPIAWLDHIALPALALGLFVAAAIARQLRGALVDALDSPYIRTAWAKGAGRSAVVLRHALKNAAMPAITVLGVQIGQLLGGAVIIEVIFSLPGLGTYLFTGLINKDIPVVQGVVLVFVLGQVLMSLLVDISYGFLNPKVRVA